MFPFIIIWKVHLKEILLKGLVLSNTLYLVDYFRRNRLHLCFNASNVLYSFFFAKVFFYFHNFLRPLRNTCHRRNSFTAIWQRVIFLSAMIILWRYLTLAWPEMFTRVVNTKRPRVQENFLSSGWRLNLSSTIVIPRKAMCKQLRFFLLLLVRVILLSVESNSRLLARTWCKGRNWL